MVLLQMPTHVDPGQGDDAIYLWENPIYLILVLALLALLVIYMVWKKKKK